MRFVDSSLILAATDLSEFSACEHKTLLDLAVVEGMLKRPGQNELERRLLEQRGVEHEKCVLEHYRANGRTVVTISQRPRSSENDLAEAARATEAEMQAGADVIYQGYLFDGVWLGRPDFLVKRAGESRFGDHFYEVVDAKLSRHAKASAVLQLCSYTDLLARLQGREPEQFWLVPGRGDATPVPLRSADYMAFYRQLKQDLGAYTRSERVDLCPDPVEHCDVCLWWQRCEQRRRAEDHLSLVAGISSRQRDRLALVGVRRVAELGALSPTARVDGLSEEGLKRIREQAVLQLEGREKQQAVYRLLEDFESGMGLESLPLPKPGDLFLDLEGDPFVRGDGLEYLFGLLELGEPSRDFDLRDAAGEPRYRALWATNPAEEKRAFEAVIDRIMEGLGEFRDLHVYHYGHRESDAIKKLSCRHNTREEQVDELLRHHVLVDLHRVVKQSLRASVEAYTLKELERLYHFERSVRLRDAARAMQLYGWWLETGEGADFAAEIRSTIEHYNEDDCRSTWQLRDWLEMRRPELELQLSRPLSRPAADTSNKETKEQSSDETARVVARLTEHLPEDPESDDESQRTLRLLANLLDWHWREAKSSWWEYFRSLELPRDERLDDRAVLSDLRFVGDRGPIKKSRLLRYEFPAQEHRIRAGDTVLDPDTEKGAGEVVDVGEDYVELKRNPNTPHPTAVILGGPPSTKDQRARLLELGTSVAEHGLAYFSLFASARRLLLRQPPACGQALGTPLLAGQSDTVAALCELALRLDGAVLAVQGPPGSGKTYHAAHVIAQLVKAGKRVGVTANSHKVITSLIKRAVEVAKALGLELRAVHNPGSGDGDELSSPLYELETKHALNRSRLHGGEIDVLGGTAWAWSRPEFRKAVDVLVVDEAGQVSLANALAVSLAAKNLMFFGDPAQLDQPQKGVHPEGAEVSALEHLLGDALTLPDYAGVFLAETRRLHPAICRFTSDVFYDGRLKSIGGLEQQTVLGPGIFDGSGLRFVPVRHRGNSNRADEEVQAIGRLLDQLFDSDARYSDKSRMQRALTRNDVLVVAPYNAQVAALKRRLPEVLVGTVDKFQGQEAPIVIYSMTASSADDAPRGLDFLYSLNRLNVATSRAQAIVVLVASPELTRVHCKTPRQMRLVNALCAYLEHAHALTQSVPAHT